MIYAVSEIGTIADFIKAHTMYNVEDYKWNLNPRLIRLMCSDFTRIHYLSEKEQEDRKSKKIDASNATMLNDLGIPVFGFNNE